MASAWRVYLHDDVVAWARVLRASDPDAARWLMPAFAVLEKLGADVLASVGRVLQVPTYPGGPSWDCAGKTLLVDCQVHLATGVTHVRRCALVGSAHEVTAVVFRCMRSVPQKNKLRSSPSAMRLIGAAVQLLPPREAVRYAEEFQSELWELALDGASRRQQFAYSTRQFSRLLAIRAALCRPRQEGQAATSLWKIAWLGLRVLPGILGPIILASTHLPMGIVGSAVAVTGLVVVGIGVWMHSYPAVLRARHEASILRERAVARYMALDKAEKAAQLLRQQVLHADLPETRRLSDEILCKLLAPGGTKRDRQSSPQEME